MKQKIAKFMLYIYLNYIEEDMNDYNSLGKILIYPAWFIRSALVWIISPLFIPMYIFKNSDMYKKQKAKLDNISPSQRAMMNKIMFNNFLQSVGKGRNHQLYKKNHNI